MREPHLTQIVLNIRRSLCEERLGWGVWRGGGGWVERKCKKEEDKGDNEGRETRIGQNNILVGRFA